MLNFDETRFLTIQRGAVALAAGIDAAISSALAMGATNLFFLGTGGVAYLMEPAIQLLQRHSGFAVFRDYPAELLVSGNRNLTAGSIVVMPSLSGTTTESVALLDRLMDLNAGTGTGIPSASILNVINDLQSLFVLNLDTSADRSGIVSNLKVTRPRLVIHLVETPT